VFGAVELAGNEPAVPGEDGLWFGYAGHVLERAATEPFTDLSEGRTFGIGKAHTGREARSQDTVFGGEVFVLEQ